MDKEKLDVKHTEDARKEELIRLIKPLLQQTTDELEPSEVAQSNPHPLDDIFKQRQRHRSYVLCAVLVLMYLSFFLLVGLLATQVVVRIIKNNDTFLLFDQGQLQLLSVAVFGEIIVIVHTISKSLWDDKIYMDLFK